MYLGQRSIGITVVVITVNRLDDLSCSHIQQYMKQDIMAVISCVCSVPFASALLWRWLDHEDPTSEAVTLSPSEEHSWCGHLRPGK